ncbi:PQQ-dependent sugar dehydrogenase [Microlunatus flavus]|uniref:Glucose/arabinose dehydrogenase, beta-propeller fold n=1 Tax=Microlunatus flavus TaxID=1036181 RepID=A0A1H9IHT2_9ACTN|nr:gluconolaconase [Microlunatus flavus]SEQ74087.1 Glucose/arabinose dehydrogenase, beta-propeller fold [Microlunatus flavus]
MSPRRSLPVVALTGLAGLAAVALCAVPSTTATALGPPTLAPALAPAAAPKQPRLVSVTVAVPSAIDAKPLDRKRTLKVPEGWTVSVWARPKKARLLTPTPDGRILVSRPASGTITRLTPNKRGRPTSSTLLKGLRQPHGMAFDGSTLYVAESNRIDAYRYADGRATGRRTVLGGLPDAKSKDLGGAYAHALKSVAVGRDHALYVSIGSRANVSPDDRTARLQRASVLRVDPRTGAHTVFARGVRNGTGLAVAPDGALWTAVNNRDDVAYPYHRDYGTDGSDDYKKVLRAYVNDHPMEPLARLTAGRDLGWPYCNPDPDVQRGVRGTAFDFSDRGFVRDVQTNADGSRLDCSRLPKVEQGLGAHSAPLGLSFTAGLADLGAGALVGAHGSWNRQPPRAPEVAFFPYDDGGLGDQQTLVTGWQSSSGKRWGRAVAAVEGPDGAVYVSDDVAGAVYRVAPPR